jgi:kynureninase
MISNSLGAMPRQTARNLAEYAEVWATRGVRGWEDRWWEMPLEVGNKIAAIIGAAPGSVSMHENVTTAQMVALSSLRPTPQRHRLVCSAMDFPSVLYLYQGQARLKADTTADGAYDVHVVPAEPDLSVATERLLDAIDERTAVVAISHVLFRTSYIVDAAAIAAKARQVGAAVILDAYQSAGIIPVNAAALGVDFIVGGCLKWLCGGPGNAFLYTRPDRLREARPTFTGWLSRAHPFDFDADDTEVRGDAMRMMNGTPAIPAYYAALAGLDIVAQVGVDRIRANSTKMTARLLELVDRYGFTSAASRDPERLAGTVAISVPDAALVARTLKAREFLVDYRPPVGVRISPHFYNTMDEIDQVMAEVASIVKTKNYVQTTAKSLVT